MGNESGEWILYGLSENDPNCIRSVEQLTDYIDEVGFLPLFKNDIPGFSVEEHTSPLYWWTGISEKDPWEWRAIIARSGRVAYGKFFDKKAGFISLDCLPLFVNYRRDGYDFDTLCDEGMVPNRQMKIMNLFSGEGSAKELYSHEIKKSAGFGKDGEKNFEGMITSLMMETYLCIRDFRQRKNKYGEEYGWPLAVYSTPENMWGHDLVTSSYKEDPSSSGEKILRRIYDLYPDVTAAGAEKVLGHKVVS